VEALGTEPKIGYQWSTNPGTAYFLAAVTAEKAALRVASDDQSEPVEALGAYPILA